MKWICVIFLLNVIIVFVMALIPAMSLPKDDPDEDQVILQDFDIRNFGFSGKDPYIQVYGLVGRTLATEEEQIFAYLFYTDTGTWAAIKSRNS